MLALVPTSDDRPHWQPGHEPPDEEYLAERERIGWQSVALIVGTIVVVALVRCSPRPEGQRLSKAVVRGEKPGGRFQHFKDVDLHAVTEVVFRHDRIKGRGFIEGFRLVQDGMTRERVEVLVVAQMRQVGIGRGNVGREEVMCASRKRHRLRLAMVLALALT
jgi:hypothetical protein